MAYRQDASGEHIVSGTFPYGDASFLWWSYIDSTRSAGWGNFLSVGPSSFDGAKSFSAQIEETSEDYRLFAGSNVGYGPNVVLGAWKLMALVKNGNAHRFYYDLKADLYIDVTGDTSGTATRLCAIGDAIWSQTEEWTDGRYGMMKAWTAVLTRDALLQDALPSTLVNTANIWSWLDFSGGATGNDSSAANNDWTVNGSPAYIAGPSFFSAWDYAPDVQQIFHNPR